MRHTMQYTVPSYLTLTCAVQVLSLEEVVRQLTHDLSVAEKAAGSSSQARADADVALKALPAAERDVAALNARVSCSACACLAS